MRETRRNQGPVRILRQGSRFPRYPDQVSRANDEGGIAEHCIKGPSHFFPLHMFIINTFQEQEQQAAAEVSDARESSD